MRQHGGCAAHACLAGYLLALMHTQPAWLPSLYRPLLRPCLRWSACLPLSFWQDPDLVVVEFSTNESPGAFTSRGRQSFEALLRALLALPSAPAVVLLHHYPWCVAEWGSQRCCPVALQHLKPPQLEPAASERRPAAALPTCGHCRTCLQVEEPWRWRHRGAVLSGARGPAQHVCSRELARRGALVAAPAVPGCPQISSWGAAHPGALPPPAAVLRHPQPVAAVGSLAPDAGGRAGLQGKPGDACRAQAAGPV